MKIMVNNQSVSQRLHEDLAKIIASTEAGCRLPSEPEFARQLGVSRATLREAMRTFETQGMLYRRQGSGTYVIHPTQVIESGLEVLESIATLADRIGFKVSMGESKIVYRTADEEEARALGIDPGSHVMCIKRVMVTDGFPVAYLEDLLPEGILSPEEVSTQFSGSVLDLLTKNEELELHSSRCEINAVNAGRQVARLMGIQRGDVLLKFVAYLYTKDQRVVDYSFSYFLPGYFRFHVIRRIGH
jgi:GntR family transcriptional regulator